MTNPANSYLNVVWQLSNNANGNTPALPGTCARGKCALGASVTQRVEGGQTYTQTFDAENRLISVAVGGQTTQFVYDGDGNLVKKINPNGSKTLYVGGIYEVDKASGGSVTRTVTYYPVAGAMRINSTLYYVLKDHLGSASVVTDASGNILGENRYYPFGETRLSTGSILTDKLYTSQREMAGLGIYHYQARFYSPKLGRFLSPDTIIPGAANPQAFNRYSYVLNNPIRYNDPTGHVCSDPDDPTPSCESGNPYPNNTHPLPSGPVSPGGPLDPGLPQGGGGGNGAGNDDESIIDYLLAILDNLAWDYIPSAIGVHGNLTWNFGGGIEGNYTPMELMLLANWRSGEISLMVSMEGSGMLTVPDLVGVSLNGGVTEVYGASTNSEFEGWSNFSGGSISLGEGLNFGASQNYGRGKASFLGGDYIDPISNRNVRYRQSAIFGAANIPLFTTPVDGSVFFGKSYTRELIGIPLPWPLR